MLQSNSPPIGPAPAHFDDTKEDIWDEIIDTNTHLVAADRTTLTTFVESLALYYQYLDLAAVYGEKISEVHWSNRKELTLEMKSFTAILGVLDKSISSGIRELGLGPISRGKVSTKEDDYSDEEEEFYKK